MTLPKIILVPTDFSDHAERALDYAIELAMALGSTVYAAHFYSLTLTPLGEPYGFADTALKDIEDASNAAMATLVARKARPGLKLVPMTRLGDTRTAVAEVVTEIGADLICMGTHGRRGLSRLIMGSVAEYVVRTASIPTLTLHAAASVDASEASTALTEAAAGTAVDQKAASHNR